MFLEITTCRLCSCNKLETLIDLGEQPLANALLRVPDADECSIPLVLLRCPRCTAIQLSVDIDPELVFRDYVWVTGTSAATVRHCEWLAQQIFEKTSTATPSILEMASNDGTLLGILQKLGGKVLGVDPARNLAERASSAGIETIPEFMDEDLARTLVAERGKFDFVIARNVLSHVTDPNAAVRALAQCVDAAGTVIIEFHRADVIAKELHYDSIYHEHTMYHSLRTMIETVERAGLRPVDLFPSPISGGSWILFSVGSDANTGATERLRQAWKAEQDSGIWTSATWVDFAERVESHRHNLVQQVSNRVNAGRTVIAYGASARSSTVLNACTFSANEIQSIADASSIKHGFYAPGTHIPIESPEKAIARNPDTILLMAFNFRVEIESMLRHLKWQGELIVAFPNEVQVVAFS